MSLEKVGTHSPLEAEKVVKTDTEALVAAAKDASNYAVNLVYAIDRCLTGRDEEGLTRKLSALIDGIGAWSHLYPWLTEHDKNNLFTHITLLLRYGNAHQGTPRMRSEIVSVAGRVGSAILREIRPAVQVQHGFLNEIRLVTDLELFGTDTQKRAARKFMRAAITDADECLRLDPEAHHAAHEKILVSLNKLSSQKTFPGSRLPAVARKTLIGGLREWGSDELRLRILETCAPPPRSAFMREIRKALSGMLQRHGLPPGETLSAWNQAVGGGLLTEATTSPLTPQQRAELLSENMRAVFRLDKNEPHCVRTLFNEFNILNFGRYPDEVLLSQYDGRNIDAPYGIIMYPRHDHNAVFFYSNQVIRHLYHYVKETHELRIMETGSRVGFARHLLGLAQRYPKHKISFAVLGGHGRRSNIRFGEGSSPHLSPSSHLSSRDVIGNGATRVADFFESDATIILESCSTGKPDGIAEQMSKLGRTVIAPSTDTRITSIRTKPASDSGTPQFEVLYGKAIAREFSNGRIVS